MLGVDRKVADKLSNSQNKHKCVISHNGGGKLWPLGQIPSATWFCKQFHWNTAMLICFYIVYSCLSVTSEGLSSCNRDCMAGREKFAKSRVTYNVTASKRFLKIHWLGEFFKNTTVFSY